MLERKFKWKIIQNKAVILIQQIKRNILFCINKFFDSFSLLKYKFCIKICICVLHNDNHMTVQDENIHLGINLSSSMLGKSSESSLRAAKKSWNLSGKLLGGQLFMEILSRSSVEFFSTVSWCSDTVDVAI